MKMITMMLLFTGIFMYTSQAMIVPHAPAVVVAPNASPDHLQLKPQEFELKTGKRLNFIQKLKFKLAQKILVKNARQGKPITERQDRQGRWSMILGIASLVLLFIPYVGLLALPAAIVALILGIKSTKGNSNTKGIIGIVTGAVTLLLFLVTVILLAALLSGGWV